LIFFVKRASDDFFIWAHPRASCARTGLSACIFFARGKKGYRCNPLRVPYGDSGSDPLMEILNLTHRI
jgi:hypothetical protein